MERKWKLLFRVMLNKLSPFKGLNVRIPSIVSIKGKGFVNQGSGLP